MGLFNVISSPIADKPALTRATVRVYDPAMCCATGICGPKVDPQLVRFAADLDWAAGLGARVERFNIAQVPKAFIEHAGVKAAIDAGGEEALPIIDVDGAIQSVGRYPSRDELAGWLGVAVAGGAGEAAACCGGATKTDAAAPGERPSGGGCC